MKMKLLKTRLKRSMAGFTLLEVLVVIIIIGILFAIAAPSWDILMNRQRVNAVREQATQLIRQAQSDARRTHTSRVVVFDPNQNGIPRAAVVPQTLNTATGRTSDFIANPTTTITNWQTLGNGDIKAGVLTFSTVSARSNDQLVFDSNGTVDPLSQPVGVGSTIFSVNVRKNGTDPSTQRCVIVTTLLGAVRQAEGTGVTGCPTS
jgi:prepilin-type N-terminal cleavage/methylation domain-containing protein